MAPIIFLLDSAALRGQLLPQIHQDSKGTVYQMIYLVMLLTAF